MTGAWLLTFAVQVLIGALCLYIQSSIKIMDVWLVCFFVFSGYLIPLNMFPPALAQAADWLPFRYQIALPVEVLTSSIPHDHAMMLIERQWGYVLAMGVLAALVWRGGLRRFAAYGG